MDFTLPERPQAVADLAAEVLSADDPWKNLARSGLLDVSAPDGLGVLEVAVLLTETGRRAPSMKPLVTFMTGALPVLRWGNADLRQALLPGVASGELVRSSSSTRADPAIADVYIASRTMHLAACRRAGGWPRAATRPVTSRWRDTGARSRHPGPFGSVITCTAGSGWT